MSENNKKNLYGRSPLDIHGWKMTRTYETKRGEVNTFPGKALPFGATIVEDWINFSVFSRQATECSLALFHYKDIEPFAVLPFEKEYQIGNVFSMRVKLCPINFGINFEELEYGYYFDKTAEQEKGDMFNKEKLLLDPYAKRITGRNKWGELPLRQYRSAVQRDDYLWDGDLPLEIPLEDLIIYEMHVRGFTADASSGVKFPGTYAGLREKIPYLKELGVNCVELLPIFEYDEFEEGSRKPEEEIELSNYWGYSPVGFFAPKAGLAASGSVGTHVYELKTLIRELHKNGIEVILDVVFNHTAEGDETGTYLSFRGIDNRTYYMLTPEGKYQNYSGCGNTLNCNNPIVRSMILDCLRYWVSEYHIDGFRFDLASILGRDEQGNPMENPPLLEELAYDPILGKCKLIAEAWDAGGLYQVGEFEDDAKSWSYEREGKRHWSEWNGRYRDSVRKFLIGEVNQGWLVAKGLEGSGDLYQKRGPSASVNFITCHDGFTMLDLFSYHQKNNYANGENNKDGTDVNFSWDCRVPSLSEDEVLALRKKMVKNAMSILLLSRGIPMILSGDEFGNSQGGNNNPYCQDNIISWLNWNDLEKNRDIFEYVKALIQLRKDYRCLRNFERSGVRTKYNYPEVSHHGEKAWYADFYRNILGTLFAEDERFVYLGMNMEGECCNLALPTLPNDFAWRLHLTSEPSAVYEGGNEIAVPSRSVMILIGEKIG